MTSGKGPLNEIDEALVLGPLFPFGMYRSCTHTRIEMYMHIGASLEKGANKVFLIGEQGSNRASLGPSSRHDAGLMDSKGNFLARPHAAGPPGATRPGGYGQLTGVIPLCRFWISWTKGRSDKGSLPNAHPFLLPRFLQQVWLHAACRFSFCIVIAVVRSCVV